MVVQAYILVQTNVGKAADVARAIGAIQGVTLAEDVTGPYDVIVRAEAAAWMNLASSWLPRSKASPASPDSHLSSRPHLKLRACSAAVLAAAISLTACSAVVSVPDPRPPASRRRLHRADGRPAGDCA